MTITSEMVLILICTVFVLLMNAGLTIMEIGYTRAKNTADIILKNLSVFAVSILVFYFLGFGIMYSGDGGFSGRIDIFSIGDYSSVFLDGISKWAALIINAEICALIPVIIAGVVSERVRLSVMVIISIVSAIIIYPIIGHWIFGNGWLSANGFVDYGGALICITSGVGAVVAAKLVGPRLGKYTKDGLVKAIPADNINLASVGLILGGAGFIGIEAAFAILSSSDCDLGLIITNTVIAGMTAGLISMCDSYRRYKKIDISLLLNAVLSGFAAVASGAGAITPVGALFTGLIAGFIVTYLIEFLDKKAKLDDPTGFTTSFGISAVLGCLLTGLFAEKDGLLYSGSASLLGVQIAGLFGIVIWVVLVFYVTIKITDVAAGLRVTENEEIAGLGNLKSDLGNEFVEFMPSLDKANASEEESELSGVARKDIPIDEAIPVKAIPVGAVPEGKDIISKIDIICKQSKFAELKDAMNSIGITGMTVTQVLGCGIQKGAKEYYRGVPLDIQLLPKVRIEIIVAKIPVEKVVNTARKTLYTGHIGDGKIFVSDIRDAIKVRTGETGYDAMQGLDII